MSGLTALGWDPSHEDKFEPEWRDAGYVPARVIREDLHQYTLHDGTARVTAKVTGRFRHEAEKKADFPAVGDWVAYERIPQAGLHLIHALLPRRSAFTRHAVTGRTDEQVVAANIDTVFLVSGLDGDFNPRRIERYLTAAQASHANAVVVLNKTDLCEDVQARVKAVEAVAMGSPVHAISAVRGDGLEDLHQYLTRGRTIAILGMSGVGKSTLINSILGEKRMATTDVREGDSRGRHTTTHRELVVIENGPVFIDTPGMRQLSVWGDAEETVNGFEDIEELAEHCRFSDCGHRSEPGCAVLAAIETGEIEGKRLKNYFKMQREFSSSLRRQAEKELMLAQREYRKIRDEEENGARRRSKKRRRRR